MYDALPYVAYMQSIVEILVDVGLPIASISPIVESPCGQDPEAA